MPEDSFDRSPLFRKTYNNPNRRVLPLAPTETPSNHPRLQRGILAVILGAAAYLGFKHGLSKGDPYLKNQSDPEPTTQTTPTVTPPLPEGHTPVELTTKK